MRRILAVLLCASSLLAGTAEAQQSPAAAPAAQSAPAAPPAAAPAAEAGAPKPAGGDAMEGLLAYYGHKFAGRRTASGERFNPNAMTMAHNTLAFGTRVRVTNVRNGKSVEVRVNDRGPHGGARIGDVSQAAARRLGMLRAGVVEAKLEVLGGPAEAGGGGRK